MQKCRLFANSFRIFRKPLFFSTQKPKKPYKYCDKYDLTEEEIDKILKKKPKSAKPENVAFETPQSQTIDFSTNKDEEKLKQIFSAKLNYEIPDKFIADLEKTETPPKSPNNLTKKEEQKVEPPAEIKLKYGLPVKNVELPSEEVFEFDHEKLPAETTNMRVMSLLNINADTPYETYELELQKKFNFGEEILLKSYCFCFDRIGYVWSC